MTDVPPPPPHRDSTWPVLSHLSTFSGYLVPLGNVLGPLVIWLVKRDEDPETEHHAREALNFQISLVIWLVLAILLAITGVGLVLAIPMFVMIALGDLILTIVAAVKASNGVRYEYPLTFRLVGAPRAARAKRDPPSEPLASPEAPPPPPPPRRRARRTKNRGAPDNFEPYDPARDTDWDDEPAR